MVYESMMAILDYRIQDKSDILKGQELGLLN